MSCCHVALRACERDVRLDELSHAFARLESTAGRIEIVDILADLLRRADEDELDAVVHLTAGRLRPPWEGVEFGVGEKLLLRILADAFGTEEAEVIRRFREAGDLGLVAESLARPARVLPTVGETYRALLEVARASGAGSQQRKMALLADLLKRVGPGPARYLVRVVQGRLRLGVGDQTLLEAIALAFLQDRARKDVVEHAYNVLTDLGRIARMARSGGEEALSSAAPQVGVPIRPALAQRLASAEEVLRRLEEAQIEPKYDGFRLQLHWDGEGVRAFSRRLEDVTGMFPDVTDALSRQLRAESAILEGEAVVYNPETGEFLPFQVTMTRKRKYRIEEMAERYPLRLFAFDLLYADGRSLLARPTRERRAELERRLPSAPDAPVQVAEARLVRSVAELQAIFDDAVSRGLEGLLAKRPDAPYHAGARNYNWIKLKRTYQARLADTVDLVLVGYQLGRGRRAALGIGSLLGAVYDPEGDRFRTVARIGSGLTEEGWRALRRMLDEDATRERPRRVDSLIVPDVWVEPRLVVTVLADEITRSPMHTCGRGGAEPGYALRFPRILGGVRSDRAPEDATTEGEILDLYRLQGAPPPEAAPEAGEGGGARPAPSA